MAIRFFFGINIAAATGSETEAGYCCPQYTISPDDFFICDTKYQKRNLATTWLGAKMHIGYSGGECAQVCGCNETGMLERLPRCGKAFADMMQKVDVWKWCNLSEFIVYYESFTNCTEVETNIMGCYWPNPLAQSFITGIHRQFFSNCTVDRAHWEDPPDEVLIPLIAVPVVLTVAMAGLVVWRSKRTDQLL
ncbi:receptor (calcitonin) activity modifying protein 3 [Cricetulus griseus]